MKKFLVVMAVLSISTICMAERYRLEKLSIKDKSILLAGFKSKKIDIYIIADRSPINIESQIIDVIPGDGICEAGSPNNPYIITGNSGRIGKISTDISDVVPNDGIMEQGTNSNPFTITID